MTDDEDGDDGPRYEWVTNGGCERCDALDGHVCDEPLPRPHLHCDCTIIERSRPRNGCDSSDIRYDVSHAGNSHHSADGDSEDEFELIFDYTIHCWGNAQEISGEVLVSRTYGDLRTEDTDDFFEDALAEALVKIEEIALEECPACEQPPGVS